MKCKVERVKKLFFFAITLTHTIKRRGDDIFLRYLQQIVYFSKKLRF